MHEDLITVAVFHSQAEFLLARTRLESADIECFAYDENMLRIGGWHSIYSAALSCRCVNQKGRTLWLSCIRRRRWAILSIFPEGNSETATGKRETRRQQCATSS